MTAFGSLTRASGKFSLGRVETRESGVTLKYAAIPRTKLSNTCFNTGLSVFRDVLKDQIAHAHKSMVYSYDIYKAAQTYTNPDPAMLAERKKNYQDDVARLRSLRDLQAEFYLDVQRHNLPDRTPVCFFESEVIRAHEQVHGYLWQLLSFGVGPGQVPTQQQREQRDLMLEPVLDAFFAEIPHGTAFYNAYAGLIPLGNKEEILSGVVGAAVYYRRYVETNTADKDEWRQLIMAFNSYVGLPESKVKQFNHMLQAVAADLSAKYGTNVNKMMQDFKRLYDQEYGP